MNTALNIKILYDKMGTAEKKIADFIVFSPMNSAQTHVVIVNCNV